MPACFTVSACLSLLWGLGEVSSLISAELRPELCRYPSPSLSLSHSHILSVMQHLAALDHIPTCDTLVLIRVLANSATECLDIREGHSHAEIEPTMSVIGHERQLLGRY